MGQHKPHEIRQGQKPSPASEVDQPFALIQAGGKCVCMVGQQLLCKGPGVLVDSNLNMSQRCLLAAKKINRNQGFINVGGKSTYYCLIIFARPPLNTAPTWGPLAPPLEEDIEWSESSSAEGYQDGWRLERLASEEKLRELDLFSLEKGWLWGGHDTNLAVPARRLLGRWSQAPQWCMTEG